MSSFLCSGEQKLNFFTVEFLYGALHLSDSTSHNVAMRFLIFVLSNKVPISLRCVAPHGFCQNTLLSCEHSFCPYEQKLNFFTDSTSHNVAMRF
jgi:hypothetical protein